MECRVEGRPAARRLLRSQRRDRAPRSASAYWHDSGGRLLRWRWVSAAGWNSPSATAISRNGLRNHARARAVRTCARCRWPATRRDIADADADAAMRARSRRAVAGTGVWCMRSCRAAVRFHLAVTLVEILYDRLAAAVDAVLEPSAAWRTVRRPRPMTTSMKWLFRRPLAHAVTCS